MKADGRGWKGLGRGNCERCIVERPEIHLPQLLNEEAIAEEFSNWEQVSSVAAERFVHRPSPPLARLRPLPSAFPHNLFPSLSE